MLFHHARGVPKAFCDWLRFLAQQPYALEQVTLPGSRCNVCGKGIDRGRLFLSNYGHGLRVSASGHVWFQPWRVDDPAHGQFLVCSTCFHGLDHNLFGLAQRVLRAHNAGRN